MQHEEQSASKPTGRGRLPVDLANRHEFAELLLGEMSSLRNAWYMARALRRSKARLSCDG